MFPVTLSGLLHFLKLISNKIVCREIVEQNVTFQSKSEEIVKASTTRSTDDVIRKMINVYLIRERLSECLGEKVILNEKTFLS